MQTIGAFEAKTRLAELLRQVETGQTILITRRGRPVARLVPPEDPSHTDMESHIARMRERRKRLPELTTDEVKSMAANHGGRP